MTRRARRGEAAIEFALVAPLLLLLLLGVIDWSWWMFHRMTFTVASHRGVRIAASVPPQDDPVTVAGVECAAWIARFGADPSTTTIAVTVSGTDENGTVAVRLSQPFDPLVGLLPIPEVLRAGATGPYYGGVYAEE